MKLNKIVTAFVFILLSFGSFAQNKNYFIDYQSLAKDMENKYHIPSCVILAVGYLESAGGTSNIAKRLNNHFGIVGNSQPAISGYKSQYRYFPSIEDSFIGFCKLVSSKKFYENMKGSKDAEKWVKNIAAAGYAADATKWGNAIIAVINRKCPK